MSRPSSRRSGAVVVIVAVLALVVTGHACARDE